MTIRKFSLRSFLIFVMLIAFSLWLGDQVVML